MDFRCGLTRPTSVAAVFSGMTSTAAWDIHPMVITLLSIVGWSL